MALYMQETLKVAPKLQADYLRHAEAEYLPAARAAGLRAMGFWRVASFKGEPSEIVALWELDDWAAVSRMSGGDPAAEALRRWHEKAGQWVLQRDAMVMRQRAHHLEAADRQDMATRFCFHETMIIQPNKERDYVLGIETQLGKSYELQGMHVVGEFQPAFRSGLVINFWTVAHGFDSIGIMGRQEAEPFFTGAHWMEIALALRTHWRSVWLVPLPIRLEPSRP